MSRDTAISQLVEALSQCLATQVEALVADYPEYLANSPEPAHKCPSSEMITLILGTRHKPATSDEPDAQSDEKFAETALTLAFQSTLQLFLDEYVQDSSWGRSDRPIDKSLDQIFALLDIAILLQLDHPRCKRIFYELLSLVLKFLLPCSVYSLGDFWDYMDTRIETVKSRAFDSTSIADRLAVLEVHNGIISAFTLAAGLSSLYNPSWADDLKSRVQCLLSSIVLFEDTTGLNKHFKIADRNEPNAHVSAPFLKDILFLHKVINNPFRVLAPTMKAELKETILVVKGVYSFLLREEKVFLTSHPPPRSITIMPAFTRSELSRKGELLHYFSDSYWLYFFDSENSESTDTEYIKSKLSEPTVRTQYLFMICMLANLYIENTASARKDLLLSVGAAPNAKFITDETLPDVHKEFFESVKLDIISVFDEYDPSFAALINRACALEKTWWGWLINGKDPKTNKQFINDNFVSDAELARIQDKQVLPFKDKKYFNTYITPQLSRKMRTETGLTKLAKATQVKDTALEERINSLTEQLESNDGTAEKQDLLESRTAVYWSLLRLRRLGQWCEFAKDLKMDIINPNPSSNNADSNGADAASEPGSVNPENSNKDADSGETESTICDKSVGDDTTTPPRNATLESDKTEPTVEKYDSPDHNMEIDQNNPAPETSTPTEATEQDSTDSSFPSKRACEIDESNSKRPQNSQV